MKEKRGIQTYLGVLVNYGGVIVPRSVVIEDMDRAGVAYVELSYYLARLGEATVDD